MKVEEHIESDVTSKFGITEEGLSFIQEETITITRRTVIPATDLNASKEDKNVILDD